MYTEKKKLGGCQPRAGLGGDLFAIFTMLAVWCSQQFVVAEDHFTLPKSSLDEMYYAAELNAMAYNVNPKTEGKYKHDLNIESLGYWEEGRDKALVAKIKDIDVCYGVFRGTDDVNPTFDDIVLQVGIQHYGRIL